MKVICYIPHYNVFSNLCFLFVCVCLSTSEAKDWVNHTLQYTVQDRSSAPSSLVPWVWLLKAYSSLPLPGNCPQLTGAASPHRLLPFPRLFTFLILLYFTSTLTDFFWRALPEKLCIWILVSGSASKEHNLKLVM